VVEIKIKKFPDLLDECHPYRNCESPLVFYVCLDESRKVENPFSENKNG